MEETEDSRRTGETRPKLVGRQKRAGTRVRQSGAQGAQMKDAVFLGLAHAWSLTALGGLLRIPWGWAESWVGAGRVHHADQATFTPPGRHLCAR